MDAIAQADTSAEPSIPIIITHSAASLRTTLTRQQLIDLFPNLPFYIDPLRPNTYDLTSAVVTYQGIEATLRWREAEFQQPNEGILSSLPEAIEIYNALVFLGNKATSRAPRLLDKQIKKEIQKGISFDEYQSIWALRSLPCVDMFIDAIVRRILQIESKLVEAVENTSSHVELKEDIELQEMAEVALQILKWANSSASLKYRLQKMKADIEVRNKCGMLSVHHLSTVLETVQE